jgi:phosphopantothenoylcysteine decarboxylase/phosphopantothenate--cysteine ligase
MASLSGKKIILGVTGSIAAYKSALLVRLLVKEGAEVRVVMTPSSRDFITPLTLATLSKNEVKSDFTEDLETGTWSNHVEMGLWGDVFLVAPASANTLAKMATGVCDNFLLAVYLSAKCPVMVAPAMDLDMHSHVTTQGNIQMLRSQNRRVIEAESGELASGLEGKGRMAEPEHIVEELEEFFFGKKPLTGKKALVSAGPTYEAIDPVRFIGNHSSGKMGYRIAEELSAQGASVTLVTGPSHEKILDDKINVIPVTSAKEMYDACTSRWASMDIGVMAAAVADYRPSSVADQKLKKSESELSIKLERTDDIVKHMGEQKGAQFLVGFALETNDAEENARKKLEVKNLDMIVLNSLEHKGAGFGHETNRVSFILPNNKINRFELKSKSEVAVDLVSQIIEETK